MQGSLRDKTARGVGWSFIDNIANSGITFLVGLVLARLLTPEEYGVMAMIAIFIAVSDSIIDSGFSNALIRKVDIERIDYNTVFYFNLIVSISLYILLFFVSPAISAFFREPVLVDVMRVIGFVLIVNALAIIPRTIFIRNINFKTQTKVSLIASISSGVVGIGMALSGMGVWSLVGQQLSRQLLNTVFLWGYCKWKPVFEFSAKSFKEMFGFGSKLLVSGLLDTIYKDIYYLVIGRFFTSFVLGQYTRAKQYNTIFSSNLTTVVQRVSYPVLSSIQNEPERLCGAYRKVIKSTMLVTFACMLGLAAMAKPLIIILIGEKWLPAAGYLQIICFSGMLYPLHAIKLNSFVAYFLNSYYSADLINYPTVKQIKDILPTFCVSIAVAAAMWGLSFFRLSVYLLLPLQLLLGVSLAYLVYERTALPEYLELRQVTLSLLKRKSYT